jgi:hypothetical protein
MSAQAFEIRCPACGSVVPPDAKGCTCASAASRKRAPVDAAPAVSVAAPPAPAAPAPGSTPAAPRDLEPGDVVKMRLKDYHRLVQINHQAVEGTLVAGRSSGSRLRAYLPFLILVIGLLIGAGMLFGKF